MITLQRESFIFYRSFYESLKCLSKEEQLDLFTAICEKALYNNDTKLTGIAESLYILIAPQIDANTKRYEDGKRGGRPRKNE